jgi:hypothetical protein
MAKVIVNMGWNKEFVMDSDKALTLLDLLESAELYKEVYRSKEDGGSTFHIFHQDGSLCDVRVLSNNFYNLAKLAGKPEEK